MKSSTIKMMVAFAAAGLLSGNVALAGNGFNFGGGNGGNKNGGNGNKNGNSTFKLPFGGGPSKQLYGNKNSNYDKKPCHNNNNGPYYNQPYGQVYGGRAYEPFHSTYTVLPGDSFYEVSLKEYGTSSAATYIARYNGLQTNSALVPGQTLMLPSVSPSGMMTASRAPVGENIYAPQGPITQNYATAGAAPVMNNLTLTRPVAEEARPKVAVGSTLLVDGQTFGDKHGAARLRVSGLSLPIEVIEWTTGSVKIRLPQVELTSATKADIEVLRADGTLASKTAIELETAAEQIALGK